MICLVSVRERRERESVCAIVVFLESDLDNRILRMGYSHTIGYIFGRAVFYNVSCHKMQEIFGPDKKYFSS